MGKKINLWAVRTMAWMAFILFAFLTGMNIFVTGYFKTTYVEWTYFRWDAFWISLPVIAMVILLCALVDRKVGWERASGRILVVVLVVYAVLWGTGWVCLSKSRPVADRYYVSAIAQSFIAGDYSWYEAGRYLFFYPYQTGIAAFIELVYRLVGSGNYDAVKMVNVAAVAFSLVAVYCISGAMHEGKDRKKLQNLSAALCFGCLAALFFVTYVYGNLIGMALALWAIFFEMKYLKEDKWIYMIPSSLCIAAGLLLKNNYSIVLVAMVIFLLLDGLEKKRLLSAGLALCLVLLCVLSSKGLMAWYSHRAQMELNDGVPKILWVQMGLKEGWFGKGTYDSSTLDIYVKNDYDAKASAAEALKIVGQRLDKMRSEPFYGIGFFMEKTALQWCEPTYMSIWESNCTDNSHYEPVGPFARSVYTGGWHDFFIGFMDIYQSLIWICAAVYIWFNRRKMNGIRIFPATIIMGGFVFHTFWESKSQYILQYFVMLIPYAAGGLSLLMDKVPGKGKGHTLA